MNESNYEAEFVLPQYLQEKADDVADRLAIFLIEVMRTLYPDDEFPENYLEETLNFLLPTLMESLGKAIDKHLEEQG